MAVAPKRGLTALSRDHCVVAGEARRPHAGGQSQPGERLELVLDEERLEVGGRTLGIGDRRRAAPVVEDAPKS